MSEQSADYVCPDPHIHEVTHCDWRDRAERAEDRARMWEAEYRRVERAVTPKRRELLKRAERAEAEVKRLTARNDGEA